MGSLRTRVVVLVVASVLVIGAAVAYIASSRVRKADERAAASPAAQTGLDGIIGGPHIVFRNTNKASSYGQVAVVSLAEPSGPRAITSAQCERVYATRQRYLCLSPTSGVTATYTARVLTAGFADEQILPLVGIPSRARLSRDGTLAATTAFTSGDSYAGTTFTTQTLITRVGGDTYGTLENFTLSHAGQQITPADRNYWGVTFAADGDTFYATVQWSQHTWLVKGSLSQRLVVTLREDAECPSLSPDGRSIVYKQRGSLPPGQWRLVRYDVATGQVSQLGESRSVDDQVEWLDDSTVIYGIARTGPDAGTADVWEVSVVGASAPRLLIPEAWSPSVVM